ncbi:GDSL-type esterase/lipase family protein [Acidobacteria bacterium AH-259-G07]|nr:GDSL-type esterase/lipase family protein [Acidobacteria bacterium AH-259-G07]
MSKHFFFIPFTLLLILAGAPGLAASEPVDVEQYRTEAVERWENEIEKLEARDKAENHPDDSILFIGSSSIRRWEDIATDMAPYHAIQRGFGGSRWSDVAVFAERLITPHKFRGLVFFVGNDIAGREGDKTPEEVAGLFAYVLEKVREHNPTAPVFYIAVTPTPSRWKAWPQIKAANTAARLVCDRSENTYFIGTESIFLDGAGEPRPELFVKDQLHQNRNGYILWTAAIKSHLDAVLDGAKR